MRPRFPSIQFLVFTSRSFKSVGGNLAVLTGADLATLAEEFDALASKTTSIHQPNVVRHPVEPKEEQIAELITELTVEQVVKLIAEQVVEPVLTVGLEVLVLLDIQEEDHHVRNILVTSST